MSGFVRIKKDVNPPPRPCRNPNGSRLPRSAFNRGPQVTMMEARGAAGGVGPPRTLSRSRMMALTATQLAQQKKQAEEMLFEGPDALGFAKALFFGRFRADQLFPYPTLPPAEKAVVDDAVAKVRQFAAESIDAA